MIEVTAAILNYNSRLLIAQRKETGKLPNVWEFPGGKVEAGETSEDCLKREMKEEFNIGVTVGEYLGESIYHYDHGSIRLLAYRTNWIAGEFTIRDHQAIKWVNIDDLANYNFAPADISDKERRDADALLRIIKRRIAESDSSVTGFNMGMNCGESAGQTIFHTHIHLIPRRDGDTSNPRGGVRGVIPEKMGY